MGTAQSDRRHVRRGCRQHEDLLPRHSDEQRLLSRDQAGRARQQRRQRRMAGRRFRLRDAVREDNQQSQLQSQDV